MNFCVLKSWVILVIRTHNSSIQCKVSDNSLQRIFAPLPFTHDYRARTVSLFKAHPTSIHIYLIIRYIPNLE